MLGKEKPGGKLITSHSSGLPYLQMINVTSFGGSMALRWFENGKEKPGGKIITSHTSGYHTYK
jgi:hypothetical protein